ncbi:platelet glycoprotein VI isoform X16 [Gallus gallus]|uniref:platelet glycoprotein VI isoform X16 n=1 Tax=Gallus gallus TaxID=9031 RepID=UPI001AE892D5|nr:platelet glycoprotein VI isoform X16 [Gallus gallus]
MTRREVALILVSLSPGCSCLMTPMAVALILGWWLVTVSWAQQLPQPFLSLHPSQGVSLGNNVTLRCHLPRVDAWVQLWHNGTLRFKKEKNKEQDAAEFSFAVTNLEDAGTYQCRYQVSKPLRTSKKSDPVELVLTGVSPEMPESVQFQGFPTNSEDLTYAEMPAAIPCPQPPTYPTAPQSPVIYTTVSTDLPR